MEGVTSLLSIGSLNYYFGGSEQKLEKKSSKTSISDWDMDVQRPGFEHGFGHVLEHLKKNSENIIDLAPILRPLGGLDEDNLELTWCGVGLDRSSTVHSRM